MKNLVLKTALITLGATVFLVALIFGLCALCAPATMMRVTATLGMRSASGDYAYTAYEKEDKCDYLAYSCEVAIVADDYEEAISRLDVFFAREDFASYCASRDASESGAYSQYIKGSYAQYLYGGYACALYRTGKAEEAITFAVNAAGEEFPSNNAVVALAYEAKEDREFCGTLAEKLRVCPAAGQQSCQDIITLLEDFCK